MYSVYTPVQFAFRLEISHSTRKNQGKREKDSECRIRFCVKKGEEARRRERNCSIFRRAKALFWTPRKKQSDQFRADFATTTT